MANIVVTLWVSCRHTNKKIIKAICPTSSFYEVVSIEHNKYLDNLSENFQFHVEISSDSKDYTEVEDLLLLTGDVLPSFKAKYLKISCVETGLPDISTEILAKSETIEKNAFSVLLATSRKKILPAKKITSSGMKTGITKKDELFNSLIDDFKSRNILFSPSTAELEGKYILQKATLAQEVTRLNLSLQQTCQFLWQTPTEDCSAINQRFFWATRENF